MQEQTNFVEIFKLLDKESIDKIAKLVKILDVDKINKFIEKVDIVDGNLQINIRITI